MITIHDFSFDIKRNCREIRQYTSEPSGLVEHKHRSRRGKAGAEEEGYAGAGAEDAEDVEPSLLASSSGSFCIASEEPNATSINGVEHRSSFGSSG
ncbi:hypothetical protein KGF56_002596 [Candida oxycetoniae]|uniref:Uncharacterized protein n=1 Tax=Candida oxycetoniae TaxID=497107 RepID=A0AAI9SXL1_9ASCO|nr:uncharacterized protein KGF56_002596 [Candida oxycetoniae]KAI3404601.2 hypothetical protein KGF56_002596 [Candida oxycetoniae]